MNNNRMTLGEFLEFLQSHGQYWLLRSEAMRQLDLSASAFRLAAHRLKTKGKLKRVRNDFHVIVPPEYRAMGTLPASWFIDPLMAYLKQRYYVGLLTAAAFHGASHQQPMIWQVMTDQVTRPITVGQVRIEFFYKKTIAEDAHQPMKTATGYMALAIPEMTAFDLVHYMSAAGHVHHVATVLSELAPQLSPDQLASLLDRDEVAITAAQRLGHLLESVESGLDLQPVVNVLKNKNATQKPLITHSDQPVHWYDQRWRILVNEIVEPDNL